MGRHTEIPDVPVKDLMQIQRVNEGRGLPSVPSHLSWFSFSSHVSMAEGGTVQQGPRSPEVSCRKTLET